MKKTWLSLSTQQQFLWIVALCFIAIMLHAAYYFPFFSDDALITLRYAERFLDGKGLTWNDGEKVEGYSNLLWLLLVSAPGYFGIDLVLSARIMGVLCVLSTLFAFKFFALKNGLKPTYFAIIALFYASTAPIVVWAIGGLEQPLVIALLAWAIAWLDKALKTNTYKTQDFLLPYLLFGLLTWTRPDGILFAAATSFALLTYAYISKTVKLIKPIILISFLPLLFVVTQVVFRLYYYGEWLPNTAYAKISPSIFHTATGILYCVLGLIYIFPFTLLFLRETLKAVINPAKTSYIFAITFITISLFLAYLIFIGGDIFPSHRHLVPLVILLVYLSMIQKSAFWVILLRKKYALWLLWVLFMAFQFAGRENNRSKYERWEFNGKTLAENLKNSFGKKGASIAVTAAGCLPFWSKMPAIDMLGLNDYYLARHPPKKTGSGFIGHELGDARYILQRKPDIIIWHIGAEKPMFFVGQDMDTMRYFHENYIATDLSIENRKYTVFIFKNSPKIGVQSSDSTMEIPAYLFQKNHGKTLNYFEGDRVKTLLSQGDTLFYKASFNNKTEFKLELFHSNSTDYKIECNKEKGIVEITNLADSDLFFTSLIAFKNKQQKLTAIE